VASVGSFIYAPVLVTGLLLLNAPPPLYFFAAVVSWLGAVYWVMLAHFEMSRSIGRMIVVSLGLTLAMLAFAIVGISIGFGAILGPGLHLN
jgi:hypothetical protein